MKHPIGLMLCCFVLFMATLLWAATAQAAPLLTTTTCSTADEAVTGAKLKFGTQAYIDVPVFDSCGTGAGATVCPAGGKTICYDLGTLPNGPFNVVGQFVNVWGPSNDSAPLSGTKAVPLSPQLLKIIN